MSLEASEHTLCKLKTSAGRVWAWGPARVFLPAAASEDKPPGSGRALGSEHLTGRRGPPTFHYSLFHVDTGLPAAIERGVVCDD